LLALFLVMVCFNEFRSLAQSRAVRATLLSPSIMEMWSIEVVGGHAPVSGQNSAMRVRIDSTMMMLRLWQSWSEKNPPAGLVNVPEADRPAVRVNWSESRLR
jgi:hypothetical protein